MKKIDPTFKPMLDKLQRKLAEQVRAAEDTKRLIALLEVEATTEDTLFTPALKPTSFKGKTDIQAAVMLLENHTKPLSFDSVISQLREGGIPMKEEEVKGFKQRVRKNTKRFKVNDGLITLRSWDSNGHT